jgi:hypothetical protein
MWEEIVIYYKVLSHHLPGELRRTMKTSVRIAGLQVEIQTWDILCMEEEGNHTTIIFCHMGCMQ